MASCRLHVVHIPRVLVVYGGEAVEHYGSGGLARQPRTMCVAGNDWVAECLASPYCLRGCEGDEAREHGVDGRFAVDILQPGVQVVAEGCRQHPARLGRGVVAPRVEAVVGGAARASGNVCPGAERGHVAGGEERQLGLDEHRAVDGHLLEQLVEGVAPHVAGVECGGVVGGVEQGVPRPPRAAVVVAVTVSQDAVHPAAEPQLRLPVSGSPRNLQHAAVAVGASVVVHVEESRLEVGAVCLPRLRGVNIRMGVGHVDFPRPRSERHDEARCGGTLGVREPVARSAYGRDVRVVRVRCRRVAALGLVEGGGLRLGEVGREVDRRRVGRHVLPHPHLRGIALAHKVRPQRLLAQPSTAAPALRRPERRNVLQRICRIRRVDAPFLVELPHLADAFKPFEHGSLRVVVVVDCRLGKGVERRHQAYVPVGVCHVLPQRLPAAFDNLVADCDGLLARNVELARYGDNARGVAVGAVPVCHRLPRAQLHKHGGRCAERHWVGVKLVVVAVGLLLRDGPERRLLQLGICPGSVLGGHAQVVQHNLVALGGNDARHRGYHEVVVLGVYNLEVARLDGKSHPVAVG